MDANADVIAETICHGAIIALLRYLCMAHSDIPWEAPERFFQVKIGEELYLDGHHVCLEYGFAEKNKVDIVTIDSSAQDRTAERVIELKKYDPWGTERALVSDAEALFRILTSGRAKSAYLGVFFVRKNPDEVNRDVERVAEKVLPYHFALSSRVLPRNVKKLPNTETDDKDRCWDFACFSASR